MLACLVTLNGCKVLSGKKKMDVILGTKAPDTAAGEYLNHTVGGNAGAAIGYYMDKQAKKLRKKMKEGKVERIGEGILITFDSTSTFAWGSYELTPQLKANLDEIAELLDDYENTEVIIEAHADSSGSSNKNLDLSEKRAIAVARYIESKDVDKYRMTTIGYGEDIPAVKKEAKIHMNRRVEIVIIANRELRMQAVRGDIED
jgi:outer membrane protein OmpA-like peptidoglycan-associated protein